MRHIYDIIREFFIYISYAYHIYHIYKKFFLCTHNLYDIHACIIYELPSRDQGTILVYILSFNIYIYIYSV